MVMLSWAFCFRKVQNEIVRSGIVFLRLAISPVTLPHLLYISEHRNEARCSGLACSMFISRVRNLFLKVLFNNL